MQNDFWERWKSLSPREKRRLAVKLGVDFALSDFYYGRAREQDVAEFLCYLYPDSRPVVLQLPNWCQCLIPYVMSATGDVLLPVDASAENRRVAIETLRYMSISPSALTRLLDALINKNDPELTREVLLAFPAWFGWTERNLEQIAQMGVDLLLDIIAASHPNPNTRKKARNLWKKFFEKECGGVT